MSGSTPKTGNETWASSGGTCDALLAELSRIEADLEAAERAALAVAEAVERAMLGKQQAVEAAARAQEMLDEQTLEQTMAQTGEQSEDQGPDERLEQTVGDSDTVEQVAAEETPGDEAVAEQIHTQTREAREVADEVVDDSQADSESVADVEGVAEQVDEPVDQDAVAGIDVAEPADDTEGARPQDADVSQEVNESSEELADQNQASVSEEPADTANDAAEDVEMKSPPQGQGPDDTVGETEGSTAEGEEAMNADPVESAPQPLGEVVDENSDDAQAVSEHVDNMADIAGDTAESEGVEEESAADSESGADDPDDDRGDHRGGMSEETSDSADPESTEMGDEGEHVASEPAGTAPTHAGDSEPLRRLEAQAQAAIAAVKAQADQAVGAIISAGHQVSAALQHAASYRPVTSAPPESRYGTKRRCYRLRGLV